MKVFFLNEDQEMPVCLNPALGKTFPVANYTHVADIHRSDPMVGEWAAQSGWSLCQNCIREPEEWVLDDQVTMSEDGNAWRRRNWVDACQWQKNGGVPIRLRWQFDEIGLRSSISGDIYQDDEGTFWLCLSIGWAKMEQQGENYVVTRGGLPSSS